MDGVIVHSTPLHNRAWEIYLGRHGIAPGEIESRMHGLRNDEIVRDYFGDGLDGAAVFQHGADKERLYRELMRPELEQWLVPGVREFLDAVPGVPKAVASNAERPNIDFVLDQAGLRQHFRFVVDGHQAARPKPFPDIYLAAAAMLGVDPVNCIVFEDSLAGVQAAKEAGARVVGLTTTLPELPRVQLAVKDFRDPDLPGWLATQRVQ
jgi:HAD superfamily hydrolase (TIGR01509 family)